MAEEPLVVGVIGFGYWGPNLVRNFTACPATHVKAVADLSEARRSAVAGLYPWIELHEQAAQIFSDPEIDAVAVATPLFSHYPLARAALEAGKHVLVEKPMATSVAECEELARLAEERGLTLMVDHTFVYTGAVRKIREVVEGGQLGNVLYFDSVRINLGLFQPDYNVVWDLAPHDLSILDYTLGREPDWVSAVAASHYDGHHENLAYLTVGFAGNLLAHVHVNWVAPVKTRRIILAGTDRMLVYDDTQPAERIKIYESSVDVGDLDPEMTYRVNIQYRTGDVRIPKLDPREALRVEVEEFADACRYGKQPVTDAGAAIRVVKMLEAAQRSIEAGGERVSL